MYKQISLGERDSLSSIENLIEITQSIVMFKEKHKERERGNTQIIGRKYM